MLLANMLITPYYMGVTQDAVIELIPKVIFPFNLVKSILNASIAMLIYKPISKILKRMGLSKSNSTASNTEKANTKTRSLIVTLVSAVIVIAAFLVLFFVLGGKIA